MGEVSNNLKKFADSDLGKYLYDAMKDACSAVYNSATSKVPIGDTGYLSRSIDFDVAEDGSEGVVYSNCDYAPYVEIGTGIYSSKGTGRKTPWSYHGANGCVTTSGNKPKPFMEPALMENQNSIIESFEGLF